jgi:hypothetical protein
VIAPANTGNDNSSRIAVTNIAHTNKGNLCRVIPGALILSTVVIKLIAPKIEEIPDKCRLNIAKSTLALECACIPANGGYTVHPVPAPFSTNEDTSNNIKDGGNNQKLTLFSLGKAIKFVINLFLISDFSLLYSKVQTMSSCERYRLGTRVRIIVSTTHRLVVELS